LNFWQKSLAFVGECDDARGALEQADAKLGLKFADPLADL